MRRAEQQRATISRTSRRTRAGGGAPARRRQRARRGTTKASASGQRKITGHGAVTVAAHAPQRRARMRRVGDDSAAARPARSRPTSAPSSRIQATRLPGRRSATNSPTAAGVSTPARNSGSMATCAASCGVTGSASRSPAAASAAKTVRTAITRATRRSSPIRGPRATVLALKWFRPRVRASIWGSLAPAGKDADPQESPWDFKWSRTPPGGDQRPPGGVRTRGRGHSLPAEHVVERGRAARPRARPSARRRRPGSRARPWAGRAATAGSRRRTPSSSSGFAPMPPPSTTRPTSVTAAIGTMWRAIAAAPPRRRPRVRRRRRARAAAKIGPRVVGRGERGVRRRPRGPRPAAENASALGSSSCSSPART